MLSSSFLASRGLGLSRTGSLAALARVAAQQQQETAARVNPAAPVVPSRGVKIPRRTLDPLYANKLHKTAPFYQYQHEGLVEPEEDGADDGDGARDRPELAKELKDRRQEVLSQVDAQIASQSYGRLFVALHLGGKQRKVTTGDLIMVDEDMGLANGDKITLDKILLVGGRDFTLLGRPLLPRDLVRVEAVAVERNLSRTKVSFNAAKALNRGTTHLTRDVQTTLRISSIELLCPIEDAKDRIGFERTDSS